MRISEAWRLELHFNIVFALISYFIEALGPINMCSKALCFTRLIALSGQAVES
jgi:hypothetical protein